MGYKIVSWTLAAYLIGSVPFGLIISLKLFGKDLRRLGSGNIGATNMLRNFGPLLFVAVLLLDAGKGALAVAGAQWLGLDPVFVLLAGFAAICGHNWSVYLRFSGGKGVATAAGVLVVAFPWQVVTAVIVVFILPLLLTRYMSLASMLGAAALPAAVLLYERGRLDTAWPYLTFASIMLVMVLYKHRDNIRRLIAGSEPRVSLKSTRAAT
ncbi:MAG: glycerol-3-phosphate 1-O-acyltransferase PlsY [Candidatus Geothermincolia bacterium]